MWSMEAHGRSAPPWGFRVEVCFASKAAPSGWCGTVRHLARARLPRTEAREAQGAKRYRATSSYFMSLLITMPEKGAPCGTTLDCSAVDLITTLLRRWWLRTRAWRLAPTAGVPHSMKKGQHSPRKHKGVSLSALSTGPGLGSSSASQHASASKPAHCRLLRHGQGRSLRTHMLSYFIQAHMAVLEQEVHVLLVH